MDIQLGKIHIHAEWQGSEEAGGAPLVFLHDGLGSVRSWGDVPRRLAGSVPSRALVFDRWGYGRSSPREIFPDGFLEEEAVRLGELLNALGLERAHLIGHSDGASIALLFAAERPDRVRSLIVEAPHTFVEPEAQAGIRRLLLPGTLTKEAPEWLARQHGERAADLLRAWTERWLSRRQLSWDVRARLGRITCPTLVVQGDRDEYATLAQIDAILQRVADSQSLILPGCGHVPHAERKEDFLRRAGEFLKERAGAGGVGA